MLKFMELNHQCLICSVQLPKPANKLFVIGDGLVVLYADGSLGSPSDLLHEAPGSSEKQQIIWADSLAVSEKNYIVAVFRSAVCVFVVSCCHSISLSGYSIY